MIEVKDFLFCDDIRMETRNKLSIMGLYGDRIVVLPKQEKKEIKLPLSILIRLKANAKIEKEVNFSLKITFEDKDIAGIEGQATFGETSVLPIPIKRLDFQFVNSGTLKFVLSISQNDQKITEHTETLSIVFDHSEVQKPTS